MKLKEVEFEIMSDKQFKEHLNQQFKKVCRGEISEHEPHKILTQERIIINIGFFAF